MGQPAKPISIARSSNLKSLSVNGKDGPSLDAIPDDLKDALAEFDISGEGVVRKKDIIRAAEMYHESKLQKQKMKKVALGLFVFSILLCGALTGLIFAVVDLSKDVEARKDGSLMVKGTDRALAMENTQFGAARMPNYTKTTAVADCELLDTCEKQFEEGNSLVDNDGNVIATAPLTEGDSLVNQNGDNVQTDAARHSHDFTDKGLWTLFDQPYGNLKSIKDIQMKTPEGQHLQLVVTSFDYREIFLKQAQNGSLIVPDGLVVQQNETETYDLVWNVLLLNTNHEKYPMVRVTQTEFFLIDKKVTNTSDPEYNSSEIPLNPKYNQTELMEAEEAQEWEDFAYQTIAEIFNNTRGGIESIRYPGTSGRRLLAAQRRGLKGYDMLYHAIPHVHLDDDEDEEQLRLDEDNMRSHDPIEVHTGRRRLLVSRHLLGGSMAKKAGRAAGEAASRVITNYGNQKIAQLTAYTDKVFSQVERLFRVRSRVEDFLANTDRLIFDPMQRILDQIQFVYGFDNYLRKEIKNLPLAIRRSINTALQPFVEGEINPCDGVLGEVVAGYNELLKKANADMVFRPQCAAPGSNVYDQAASLRHLNSPTPRTVHRTRGMTVTASNTVNVKTTYANLTINCGPTRTLLKAFLADHDFLSLVNETIDSIVTESVVKHMETIVTKIDQLAGKITGRVNNVKNINFAGMLTGKWNRPDGRRRSNRRRSLLVDGVNVPDNEDIADYYEHGAYHDFHHRKILDTASGKLLLPVEDVISLSDGSVVRGDVLPIEPLVDQAKDIFMHKFTQKFSQWIEERAARAASGGENDEKSNNPNPTGSSRERRQLLDLDLELFELEGLDMTLDVSFSTVLQMENSASEGTGGHVGMDLYKSFDGAPLRASLVGAAGVFQLKMDVELDVELPVDIKFAFPGSASATIAASNVQIKMNVVRAAKNASNPRDYLIIAAGDWSNTRVTVTGPAGVSVSSGIKVKAVTSPSLCLAGVCAKMNAEAYFEAAAGHDAALTTKSMGYPTDPTCSAAPCKWKLQSGLNRYVEYTPAHCAAVSTAATNLAAGGHLFVAGSWVYVSYPHVRVYPTLSSTASAASWLSCGLSNPATLTFKTTGDITGASQDLLDCARQKQDDPSIDLTACANDQANKMTPHPFGTPFSRRADVVVTPLALTTVQANQATARNNSLIVPSLVWPSDISPPPPPPSPPPPPPPSPPPPGAGKPDCELRNGGGNAWHVENGYGRVPSLRVECYNEEVDVEVFGAEYPVCWSKDCCNGFVLKRDWTKWMCLTWDLVDSLPQDVQDGERYARGGLKPTGTGLR